MKKKNILVSIVVFAFTAMTLAACGSGGGGPAPGATLESIDITPASAIVNEGKTLQFTALGHYSDGSSPDITTQVTWSSSEAFALITNDAGSEGLALGASVGLTVLSASLDGKTGTANFTVTHPQPAIAGQLVIAEIMNKPDTLLDSEGEWFEIYNPSATDTYGIYGCTISDNGPDAHTISDAVVIGPEGYVTLAISSVPGFTPDYVYGSFQLGDSSAGGDEIILTCSGTVIDEVLYDFPSGFPYLAGASMNLSPSAASAVLNDDFSNWCESASTYNGDRGTPGAANDVCSATKMAKTGQLTSYFAGDDGALRMGLSWPEPRLTLTYCDATGPCLDPGSDCDGNASTDLVTDNLTGLTWARAHSQLPGAWADAITSADTSSLCGHADWRIPNVNEFESLVNPGYADADCGGSPCAQNHLWLNSVGFYLAGGGCWTSTTYAGSTSQAWLVSTSVGNLFTAPKSTSSSYFTMLVRDFSNTASALWKTGQTACYDSAGAAVDCATTGQGQDGAVQAGVSAPSPRFITVYCDANALCTDQSADCDGNVSTDMVIDNLTGITWARDGGITTAKNWEDALTYVSTLSLCGYSDWRMPNIKEYRSLTDYSQLTPAMPGDAPFTNVNNTYFWSSTSYSIDAAWRFYSAVGSNASYVKTNASSVWSVRGGQ